MEKRGQNKKSQSQIITTVLIILLVLVSVIIVWNVVKPMVEESAEKINTNVFSVQLEIEEVKVWLTDNIEVKVRRDAGEGEIDSLKFVFEKAGGESEIIERKKDDGYDMPEQLETKTYEFEYSEINGKVEKVGIAPVIGANLGIEAKEPEYKIRKDDYGIRIPDIPSDPQTSLGLVSWWKFDGNVRDSVGENDGSFVDDAYANDNGELVLDGASDGSADWVEIGNPTGTLSIPNDISISFWVADIVSGIVVSGGTQYGVFATSGGGVSYWYWGATTGGWRSFGTNAGTVPTDGWNHIVLTNVPGDGNPLPKVYINGVEQVVNGPAQEVNAGGASVRIGEYGYTPYNPLEGRVDNVMIFNRVLSQNEITALYYNQLKG